MKKIDIRGGKVLIRNYLPKDDTKINIATSPRRMERFPIKLGYPFTLLECFSGGYLGLGRKSYKVYR